jgi:hypothetical protein
MHDFLNKEVVNVAWLNSLPDLFTKYTNIEETISSSAFDLGKHDTWYVRTLQLANYKTTS